ncbi:MAG: radical SAM protein [Euryarchaeota archaeon]|nr:radical SAM protein [Euryarchaeota archaeon]
MSDITNSPNTSSSNSNSDSSYIFGPVPSRRLGRSLGIDITPYKTCTFDCVYCQLGRTTEKTVQRREYVPKDLVLSELERFLNKNEGDIDCITFAGSGEPTLHSKIGEMIDAIKTMTDIPVVVITNGSLLFLEDVRNDLMNTDLVLPSLDAATTQGFRAVDQPHESLKIGQIVEGLRIFKEAFEGKFWLEIMIVKGLNDSDDEISALTDAVSRIGPDRVQLNTVVRPSMEDVEAASRSEMMGLCERFTESLGHGGNVEIIADARIWVRADILPLIERRPLTIDEISDALQVHRNEAAKYLRELEVRGEVVEMMHEGKRYFTRR